MDALEDSNKNTYDVCLSFAGEDREYVRAVANCLRSLNISVFFDEHEESTLWGKDLYSHLDTVYREKARYCLMFISSHYARKLWTSHERQSAQARAFSENSEYILPARFDDTNIPGVHPTTGYVDLRSKSPNELAILLQNKLNSVSHEMEKRATDSNKDAESQSNEVHGLDRVALRC